MLITDIGGRAVQSDFCLIDPLIKSSPLTGWTLRTIIPFRPASLPTAEGCLAAP